MLLCWTIRYFDSNDKEFKDRNLRLDTETLEPATRAVIEMLQANRRELGERKWLEFRHLFQEGDLGAEEWKAHMEAGIAVSAFCIPDYFENENGEEITLAQVAPAITGQPNAIAVGRGAKQHDVDYALADKPTIQIGEIKLTEKQLRILGYFTQDLRKLAASALMREGPGSMGQHVVTVATEEEIESFIMTLRRLRSPEEIGGLDKAVGVLSEVLGPHPLARYIVAQKEEFRAGLEETPPFLFTTGGKKPVFSRKRLIVVATYTLLAHQRSKHYEACLAETEGNEELLLWYCLNAVWCAGGEIINIGREICRFYDAYCNAHDTRAVIPPSIGRRSPGVGVAESREQLTKRVFREKTEELMLALWQQNDRPEGGPMRYYEEARRQLAAVYGEAPVE